ncbi:MAG: stage sporulation protein, partial [Acidimicrobiaceae bacterium]
MLTMGPGSAILDAMGARPHLLIAGIPVRIEPSFLIIVALLGLGPNIPLNLTLAWVAVAFVSVLVHELGHAFAFRRYGVESAITLRGLGGVTTPGRALRGRSQVIITSLAGPCTTLVLFGIPTIWLFQSDWAGGDFDREVLVAMLLIINVGWSLLNLLPILPLDGGHVVEQVIGSRPAHLLSIVISLPLAAIAFAYGQPFAAILAVLFAVQNGVALNARDGAAATGGFTLDPRRSTPAPPAPPPVPNLLVSPAPIESGVAAEQLAWSLLGSGDAAAARALAARAGPSASAWIEGALALHDGAFVSA